MNFFLCNSKTISSSQNASGSGGGGVGVGGAGNANVQKATQADAKADNKGKPEATIMNFSGPEVKAGQIMKPTTDVVAPQIKEIRLAFVAGEFLRERPGKALA